MEQKSVYEKRIQVELYNQLGIETRELESSKK